MSPNGTGEAAPADDSDDRGLSLTRRKFLKRGAAVGIGAAALYIAPSMSSTQARRAYASITGPNGVLICDDTEPPNFVSIMTGDSGGPLSINSETGGYLTIVAYDNHSLASIYVVIGSLSYSGELVLDCDLQVQNGTFEIHFDTENCIDGDHNGMIIIRDCCENEINHAFVLNMSA